MNGQRAGDAGRQRLHGVLKSVAILALAGTVAIAAPARTTAATSVDVAMTHGVSRITDVSSACPGPNAEVEQAVDPSLGYVYVDWMGCTGGIGFARSTDGGLHFDPPVAVPGSVQPTWDPAIAVAPDGTVYASFMTTQHGRTYPVVAASFDQGRSFAQVSSLTPPFRQNWGDRDFIAVGPRGVVYVTWDFGPSNAAVTYICTHGGSCAFATGDLNVVLQRSTDRGRTWSPIIPVSPGYPASGGDSAPMVIEPDGRIDMEYQGYHITNPLTYTMAPAHSYFTSSRDGGNTWTAPVRVGPPGLTMSLAEWWIDGSIGMDAAGNLYVTWDSQAPSADVGWLSYSTDRGRTWSAVQRVTPDRDNATHIMEVVGGGPGVAYVGWLSDSAAQGYAQYLRPFSIAHGWLSAPLTVSRQFGKRSVWPGDTFGISMLSAAHKVVLSWGSAIGSRPKPDSEIFAAVVTLRGG